MSAMILSLSAIPCCGEDEHCDEGIQLCESEKEKPSEHQESTCSPFFTCGSCTGFNLTSIDFTKINPPLDFNNKVNNGVDFGIPQTYKTSLLKPPKQI